MILRKPYAFIIRHFRMIHIALVICVAFLLKNTNDIYQLFKSLQSTNTLTYAGTDVYINNFVYLVILIALFLAGVVYWLLKVKKKPTLLYLLMLIFYVSLSILYLYSYSVLRTIQDTIVNIDVLSILRDLTFIFLIPQYIFLALCFIRGIGFDIKRFNFSKDIEELQIVDKDSQEFELLIGQNNYKYIRFIRRSLRETKYYILENKFVISLFISGIILTFMGVGIYYYNTNIKSYGESEIISVNSISYVINKSYITAYDYSGNTIKKGYKYVVLDMTFYNSSSQSKMLDIDLITLTNGKITYRPTLTKNGKFYDIGLPYSDKQVINSNEYLDATLSFEIPESVNTNSFTLKVQYEVDTLFDNVVSRNRSFDVKAIKIDNNIKINEVKLNEIIETDVLNQNKFNITIKDYKITDSYNNKYVVCKTANNCQVMSSLINPSNVIKETLLIVGYEGTMFEGAKFSKIFNTYNKIFANYAYLKYTVYSKDYYERVNVIDEFDVSGKVFLQVDRRIVNASNISLELKFRNNTFSIPLK